VREKSQGVRQIFISSRLLAKIIINSP